jgi:TRAP-type uncharacterized transport system substrate-binding protein
LKQILPGNGQSEEIRTLAIPSLVVAHANLPDDAVYEMTKALLENNDQVAAAQLQGRDWTTEQSIAVDPTVPFHPGAVTYDEETGVWTKEMQQTQDESLR